MSLSPLCRFEDLNPVLMTIIIEYDITTINLPAIFVFLPVTKSSINNQYLSKKQGKIHLPDYLNQPGEIISMRYANNVRGIVRSKSPTSFPHSIILDIGTRDRITSVELSKTIELRGLRSFETAHEVFGYLVSIQNRQYR
jgi:hypothetical protein